MADMETITSEFFANNRARLKKLFTGTAPIVVTANGLLQRSGDSAFPFRQDSSFWYLTGINDPDILLVMDKDKEYLVVPARSASREAFDGSLNHVSLTDTSGISEILDEKTGWKMLSGRLKKAKHVATLAAAPSYVEAHGMFVNPARARLIKKLRAENNGLDLLDLRQHMTRLRMVKQAPEISAIQQAIDLTVKGFAQVKRSIGSYENEYEIEARLTGLFKKNGRDHAYQPIIAAGGNACTLHYVANSGRITPQDMVLIDVGADVNGYAADISRTYAANNEPSKRQTQVWKAVIEVQDFAMSLLKPGTLIPEYEKKVEAFMGEKLRELGLIKTIDHDTVRKYYPHATSHFLGLDVHDAADYQRALEADMILTVEPGIYIPEEQIGVRIEDDVLITDEGLRNLSEKLPREL
jgi:Xaa-Pro aminopeptidase